MLRIIVRATPWASVTLPPHKTSRRNFSTPSLCELRVAAFVESKMCKRGGYTLTRPATEISVGDVVRVIDGTLAPISCASRSRFRA